MLKTEVCRSPGSGSLQLNIFASQVECSLPHAVNVHKWQFLHNADHGGYLCTGMNNSISLLESWHLPPSSLSLTGQTRDLPAILLLPPSLPSFLSLPLFLPIFPLHSPSTRWTINREKAQISQQHPPCKNSLPDAKRLNLFPSGVVTGLQPTCLPNSII